MAALDYVTWHGQFGIAIQSQVKFTRKESSSSNPSTTINMPCYLYHMRIETGHDP